MQKAIIAVVLILLAGIAFCVYLINAKGEEIKESKQKIEDLEDEKNLEIKKLKEEKTALQNQLQDARKETGDTLRELAGKYEKDVKEGKDLLIGFWKEYEASLSIKHLGKEHGKEWPTIFFLFDDEKQGEYRVLVREQEAKIKAAQEFLTKKRIKLEALKYDINAALELLTSAEQNLKERQEHLRQFRKADFTMSEKVGWQNSNIVVGKGERVYILASGSWSAFTLFETVLTVDPAGDTENKVAEILKIKDERILDSGGWGCLICRQEKMDIRGYVIRTQDAFNVESDAPLLFSYNVIDTSTISLKTKGGYSLQIAVKQK